VLGLDSRPVILQTDDGLDLAGSYVAGHNGGVVVLVHGAGGDRSGGIRSRAAMLVRNGYGVLAYDARGGGNSEGRPEALGWTWSRDVAAAVDFLRGQGIKPERIGALGLSTGAEAVLERAGRDERIAAVVAEGAQARTLDEVRLLDDAAAEAYVGTTFVVSLTAYSLLRQVSEPPALDEMIPRISPRPVLLISAGSGYERDLNRAYARSARWPSALWELPGAPHTGALKEQPAEYERRVVAFFDRALLGR
jgi:pimeloyl-ACP methyl ester carboxylesterase